MNMFIKLAAGVALSAAVVLPSAAIAQPGQGRALVSIYQAAPGHQEALMRWLADQDRAAASVGVAPSQVYVHTDGASWDFVVIQPVTTEAQDEAVEAAASRMGLATGPRAGLELRKHIQSHTDTFVRGPMTPAQYLSALGPSR